VDPITRRRWGHIRKIGKGRFIVLAALLFSAVSLFIYAVFLRLFETETSKSLQLMLAATLVCYGPLWSLTFWTEMEKKWHEPPRRDGHWWKDLL
jgi:hypothetical protein